MQRKPTTANLFSFPPLRPAAATIALAALALLASAAPARAAVTRTVDCSTVTTSRDYVWLDSTDTLTVDFGNCAIWEVTDSDGTVVRSGTGPTGSEIVDPGGYIRFRDASSNSILRVYFRPLYPERVPSGTLLKSDDFTLPASPSEMDVGPENTGGLEPNTHWLAGNPDCPLRITESSAHVYSTYEVTVTVPGTYTFRGLSTDPPSNYVDYSNASNPIRDPYFALYQGFDPTKPDDNVIGCNDDLNDLFGYDGREMGELLGGGSFMEGHLPYFVADLQPGTYQLLLLTYSQLDSALWSEEGFGPATVSFEMWGPTGDLVDTDVEEPFAQINDQLVPNKDTWTIRGKVTDPTASTVVSDGVQSGVTVTMYESGSPATPVAGFSPFSVVDTFTFDPAECRSISNGRTLYCKDLETNSFFRARGARSAKDANSFRLTSVIRSQELTVNQPYGLPLAYEVDLSGRLWRGDTDIDYCRITQNGERTTCRLPRAGGGK